MQTPEVSEKLAAVLCLVLGVGSGAYLWYGWRKGEIIGRYGVSYRSDDPRIWWSTLLVVATFSALCLYVGISMLTN